MDQWSIGGGKAKEWQGERILKTQAKFRPSHFLEVTVSLLDFEVCEVSVLLLSQAGYNVF